jgi:hypothetical protein
VWVGQGSKKTPPCGGLGGQAGLKQGFRSAECGECANKGGEEFGVERMGGVIAANVKDALPERAGKVLAEVGGVGKQFDDQTILIVRRL